jgi:hypothetical protein
MAGRRRRRSTRRETIEKSIACLELYCGATCLLWSGNPWLQQPGTGVVAERQHPRPDARMCGGEVSLQSLRGGNPMRTGANSLFLFLRPRKGRCRLLGRLCCKSPKSSRDDFSAKRRSKPRSSMDMASGSLARLPVSSSSCDEVPHMFTRKPRLQPGKFLNSGAKRLLQHNRAQLGHERSFLLRCTALPCYN